MTELSTQQHSLNVLGPSGQMRKIEDIEFEVIRVAMVLYGNNKCHVADHLGIGRSTLYRKLEKMGERGLPRGDI